MRILIVTGSYPPDVCGGGDYTFQLAASLVQKGLDVSVLTTFDVADSEGRTAGEAIGTGEGTSLCGVLDIARVKVVRKVDSWSPRRTMYAAREMILAAKPDVIHVQYPTIGYKMGLGPQWLTMVKPESIPLVVTLHEASMVHVLRRASLVPFRFADRIITTTNEEADYISCLLWIQRVKIDVIPVGSNIPRSDVTFKDEPPVITYFGLFYPAKGLERFLEVAREARILMGEKVRFRICGQIHPKYADYYRKLRDLEGSKDVEWVIGADNLSVADLLKRSFIGLFPYPDGATFRRGTLVASLDNGLPVITTRGPKTPDVLKNRENIMFADSIDEFLGAICQLLNDRDVYETIAANARELGSIFTWDSIADRHIAVYRAII
jgi:glycosyltransferase involved in cell wall biosynthesis